MSQLACEQALSVQRLFKKHFIEIPQQRTLCITSKIIITVTQRLDPTRCQLLAEIYANAEIRLTFLYGGVTVFKPTFGCHLLLQWNFYSGDTLDSNEKCPKNCL